jgi:hypothetical protein
MDVTDAYSLRRMDQAGLALPGILLGVRRESSARCHERLEETKSGDC